MTGGWGGWNESLSYVRPHSERRKEQPMHKPAKARIGQRSYACLHDKHRTMCYKLNYPCPCHDEEREATEWAQAGPRG